MKLFTDTWKKAHDYSKKIIQTFYNFEFRDYGEKLHLRTLALLKSPKLHDAIRGNFFQFIEGTRVALTLPFSALKTIGLPETRQLTKDIFYYNILYYALPALLFAMLQDNIMPSLSTEGSLLDSFLRLVSRLFLMRAAFNSYLFNIGNNLNATRLSFHQHDTLTTDDCNCKETRHLKAIFFSPLYFASKITVSLLIATQTQLNRLVAFGLNPLIYGEAILDSSLPSMCPDKKIEYFSHNIALSYGIGIILLLWSRILAATITHLTGINSPYVYDAISNMNYAFMLLHIKDHKPRFNDKNFKDEQPFKLDLFYLIRRNLQIIFELIRNFYSSKNGKVINLRETVGKIEKIDKSPFFQLASYLILYPELNKGLKVALEKGPFHLFITLNKDKISPYIDTLISIASSYQIKREIGKRWHHKKKHIVYLLKVIEDDPWYAHYLLLKAKAIITQSNTEDHRKVKWVDNNTDDFKYVEDYNPTPSENQPERIHPADDFVVIEREGAPSSSEFEGFDTLTFSTPIATRLGQGYNIEDYNSAQQRSISPNGREQRRIYSQQSFNITRP